MFFCGGTLTVNDSELLENSASYGGALATWDATVVVSGSTLAHNIAAGGLADNPDACHNDCDIYDGEGNVIGHCDTNCAPPVPDSRGGAIYTFGHLSDSNRNSNLSISNSTISGNSADVSGGGIYANDETSPRSATARSPATVPTRAAGCSMCGESCTC